MFGPRIQQTARRIAEMVVAPFAKLGMTPNMATLLGLLLNGAVAVVLALGYLRIGGGLLVFAGLFDMIDGALARVRDQKTVFGAFFDSTLDRYSEGIVLLGLIVFALFRPFAPGLAWERPWVVVLAYAAALGSLMVSYARARAEGLGLEMKTGLMARPERVILLAAGLILGGQAWLVWTLLVLAATSVYTSVQRIFGVYLLVARQQAAQAHPMRVARGAGTMRFGRRVEDVRSSRNGHNGNGRQTRYSHLQPTDISDGAADRTPDSSVPSRGERR